MSSAHLESAAARFKIRIKVNAAPPLKAFFSICWRYTFCLLLLVFVATQAPDSTLEGMSCRFSLHNVWNPYSAVWLLLARMARCLEMVDWVDCVAQGREKLPKGRLMLNEYG